MTVNKVLKKVLGYAIIIALFVSLIAVITKAVGIIGALCIFGGSVAVSGLIVLGVWLIMS